MQHALHLWLTQEEARLPPQVFSSPEIAVAPCIDLAPPPGICYLLSSEFDTGWEWGEGRVFWCFQQPGKVSEPRLYEQRVLM